VRKGVSLPFSQLVWLLGTSTRNTLSLDFGAHELLYLCVYSVQGGTPMKKLLVATAALLAVLSLAACAGKAPIGKGKAPPPPVVTKG
jgi:hypothetical protein